ncbi:hypothetical protein [Streptomyces coerulescens]|uniref:Uncharacterized protein n=1 Tax=Streptomyces coerulescens TaxID=29304 RepID=A0ABW0CQI6_STRCD
MARTTRRYAFHRVHASLLAAALAVPVGLTSAMAHAPAQTTPPPSPTSPVPTAPPTPTAEPSTPDRTSTPTDTPTGSAPADEATPDDTPPTDRPSGPPDTEGETTAEPPQEQKQALAEVTATLNDRRDDVPEDLRSTVDSLTATLRAVTDPETTPQDRGAVTGSARALASTLGVISDDGTPGELRDRLSGLVKQVTATLEAGQEPEVADEDGSRVFLVANRTTSALDTIADTGQPQKWREQLATIVEDVNHAMEQTNGGGETGDTAVPVSSSIGYLIGSDPSQGLVGSSPAETQGDDVGNRQELTDRSERAGRQMRLASDPDSSQEEQSEARREMREQTARMKEEQRKAASDQESPDASLGKAAEVCANAIFDSVSERKLSDGLEGLTPQSWDSAGVKDFWKARAEGDDVLDVRAFLRNNENTHAPFPVAKLISSLAEVVGVDELTSDVGGISTAHCKQSAAYLEDQGVTAGDWVVSDDY